MAKRKDVQGVTQRLLQLITARGRLETRRLVYAPGLRLTPGEMHAIEAIGDREGLNVTALGERFGVTKSAASQMAARLARAGLVRKEPDPDSGREVRLVLTTQGRKAFMVHQAVHQDHQRRVEERLGRFSRAELAAAAAVLEAVREIVSETAPPRDRFGRP